LFNLSNHPQALSKYFPAPTLSTFSMSTPPAGNYKYFSTVFTRKNITEHLTNLQVPSEHTKIGRELQSIYRERRRESYEWGSWNRSNTGPKHWPWSCQALVASNLTLKTTSFDKFNAVQQQFEQQQQNKVVYCITARRFNFSTEASGQLTSPSSPTCLRCQL